MSACQHCGSRAEGTIVGGMARLDTTFGLLVLAQAAHSIEEYVGRLWETFPPMRFLTGVVSPDRQLSFLVLNAAIVGFGVWCLLWPVRRRWPSAVGLMWVWVVIETINGVVHPLWSLRQGGYTPGVITAPILLVVSLYLGSQLRAAAVPAAR